MKPAEESFVTDLKALMEKYGIGLHSYDNYGEDERFLGTSYAFGALVGYDFFIEMNWLNEQFKSIE